jgi:hypothetical protein
MLFKHAVTTAPTPQPLHSEKKLSQCHFFTINLTWTGLGSHPSLNTERPAANHLSCNMALNQMKEV